MAKYCPCPGKQKERERDFLKYGKLTMIALLRSMKDGKD